MGPGASAADQARKELPARRRPTSLSQASRGAVSPRCLQSGPHDRSHGGGGSSCCFSGVTIGDGAAAKRAACETHLHQQPTRAFTVLGLGGLARVRVPGRILKQTQCLELPAGGLKIALLVGGDDRHRVYRKWALRIEIGRPRRPGKVISSNALRRSSSSCRSERNIGPLDAHRATRYRPVDHRRPASSPHFAVALGGERSFAAAAGPASRCCKGSFVAAPCDRLFADETDMDPCC